MKKKSIKYFIILIFIVLFFTACEETKEESVNGVPGANFEEKLAWLRAYAVSDQTYIITMNASQNFVSTTFNYPGRDNITIHLRGDNAMRVIDGNISGGTSLFTVGSGVTLILDKNITLFGTGTGAGSIINVLNGGSVIMNAGARITRVFTTPGRSVAVGNGGTFIWNGGEIVGSTSGVIIDRRN
ncbi:MAG: hypothetical protein FWC97_00885 [Treponema sp.]|nr:hypothetical protein [Treponema sp.]